MNNIQHCIKLIDEERERKFSYIFIISIVDAPTFVLMVTTNNLLTIDNAKLCLDLRIASQAGIATGCFI